MPGQPTGPKVPLPAVGWRLPKKALSPFSSGSHLMPVPDFRAPSCPVGLFPQGSCFTRAPAAIVACCYFLHPLGNSLCIFSASWYQENHRGVRRPFLALQGTALLPSESIAVMGPRGWGRVSVATFPVHPLVLCGASAGCKLGAVLPFPATRQEVGLNPSVPPTPATSRKKRFP